MDEPFAALDPLTRDDLQREFLLLQQRLHKQSFSSLTIFGSVAEVASRIALMEAGKLVTV